MLRRKHAQYKDTDEIFNIPPYLIRPNPALSRTEFCDTALCSLADSIRRYGILQPLAVRLSEDGKYELIAGERRLRAAVLLKLPTVPCVLVEKSDNLEYLSVVENLQREKLGMFDEARAVKRLYVRSGKSLSKTAGLLSISESAVLKKLRLCELSRAEAQAITGLGICEDTAILLLDFPSSVRFYAIKTAAEMGLERETVISLCKALDGCENPTNEDLEAAARSISFFKRDDKEKGEESAPSGLAGTRAVIRDLKLFENSLRKSAGLLECAGFVASVKAETVGDETIYTVRVGRRSV